MVHDQILLKRELAVDTGARPPTAYLASREAASNRYHLVALRQSQQALGKALARCRRPTDDEDRVVSGERPDEVGSILGVQRRGRDLGAPRHGLDDEHLADAVQSHEELGEECIDRYLPLLRETAGGRVARSARCLDPREAQLLHVTRERGLRDLPPLAFEELAKFLLATDGLASDEVKDATLTFGFARHRTLGWRVGGNEILRLQGRY